MKKMMQWVMPATLFCGAIMMLTSCTDDDTAEAPVDPVKELASETFIHEDWMDRSVKPGDSFWQFALGTWLKNHDESDGGLFMNSQSKQAAELQKELANNPTRNHMIQLLMGPKPSKEEQWEILRNVVAQLKDGDNLTKADVMRNIGKVADMGYCALLGHDMYGFNGVVKYNITPGRLMNPMVGIFGKDVMIGAFKTLLHDYFGMDTDDPVLEKRIADVVEIDLWIKDFQRQWISTDPLPAIIGRSRDVMKSAPVPALQVLSRATTRAIQEDDELKTAFREAFHIDSETYCQTEVEQVFDLFEKYDLASLQLYLKTYLATKLSGAIIDDNAPDKAFNILCSECPSLFLDYQKAVLMKDADSQSALEMLEEVREVFAEHIKTADWLSDATKEEAQKKLQAMKFHVGAPETLFNANFKLTGKTPIEDLVQYRQQTDDYLRNQLAGKQANGECAWDLLFISPGGFGLDAINAAYEPTTNQLFIMPVFLRGDMFPSDKQSVMRYVTLMTFVHELTHGFDGNGATFDAVGNRKNWWTAEDKANFEQRQQMIVERYNELEQLPGVPANGEFTKNENIADLGGFSLAWEVWNRKLKADGLTGEALRHQQRQFFITYAYLWQCYDDESTLKNTLNTDVHSANHNRVNGIVRLIDDWYTLFGVEPGDKLYVAPEKRVKIW